MAQRGSVHCLLDTLIAQRLHGNTEFNAIDGSRVTAALLKMLYGNQLVFSSVHIWKALRVLRVCDKTSTGIQSNIPLTFRAIFFSFKFPHAVNCEIYEYLFKIH